MVTKVSRSIILGAIILYFSVYLATLFRNYINPLLVISDSDVTDYFYPHLSSLLNRDAPFPWIFETKSQAGYFTDVSGQLQSFYPIKLVLRLITQDINIFSWLYYFIHVAIAVFGIYKWLTRKEISPTNSLIAAFFYVSSPLFLAWQSLYHSLAFFAFAPFVIYFYESLLLKEVDKLRNGLFLAFSMSLLILGGHLQNAFLLAIYLLIYFFVFLSVIKRILASMITLLFSASVAALLCSYALIPFILNYIHSPRQIIINNNRASLGIQNFLEILSENFGNDSVSNINQLILLPFFASIIAFIGIIQRTQAISINSQKLNLRYLLTLILVLIIGSNFPFVQATLSLIPFWDTQSNIQRISFISLPIMILFFALGLETIDKWSMSTQRVSVLLLIFAFFIYFRNNFIFSVIGFIFLMFVFLVIIINRIYFPQKAKLFFILVSIIAIPSFAYITDWSKNNVIWPELSRISQNIETFDEGNLWTMQCVPVVPFEFKTSANLLSNSRFLDSYDSFVSENYFVKMQALTGTEFSRIFYGGQWYQGTEKPDSHRATVLRQNLVGRILVGKNCDLSVFKNIYEPLGSFGNFSVLGALQDPTMQRIDLNNDILVKFGITHYFKVGNRAVLPVKYSNRIQFLDKKGNSIKQKKYLQFFTSCSLKDIDQISDIRLHYGHALFN